MNRCRFEMNSRSEVKVPPLAFFLKCYEHCSRVQSKILLQKKGSQWCWTFVNSCQVQGHQSWVEATPKQSQHNPPTICNMQRSFQKILVLAKKTFHSWQYIWMRTWNAQASIPQMQGLTVVFAELPGAQTQADVSNILTQIPKWFSKVVFLNRDFPISMSRQKVGMQWRKHTVAVQKCTPIVDHAGSQF
jgi:hypothetical protein